MQLKIYATKGREADGGAPMLFTRAAIWSALPFHPDGGEWVYLATASSDDQLFGNDSKVALRAIELMGFYIHSPEGGTAG